MQPSDRKICLICTHTLSLSDVFGCSPLCADDEICENRHNIPTCECNSSIYNGKTTADVKPSVTCESNVMTISVSKCLLQYLHYDYTSLQLNTNSTNCIYIYTEIINNQSMLSVQAAVQSEWCGNIVTNGSSKISYTNTLYIEPLGLPGTGTNNLAFPFTCTYNNTSDIPGSTTVLDSVTGGGSYTARMTAYRDSSFTIKIQNGDFVEIESDIYLGISVSEADGNKLALTVTECIASPTMNRSDLNTVQLMSQGCAYPSAVHTEVISNGESLEATIRIQSFQFRGYSSVNIFCNVTLCGIGECTGCLSARTLPGNAGELAVALQLQDSFFSSTAFHKAVPKVVMVGALFAFVFNKHF
uniref:ZP domain-containing protein n=1 Tax=Leptobrachium leishanense TaxID=445787 RepID=A0A8C5M1M0_9ANUR